MSSQSRFSSQVAQRLEHWKHKLVDLSRRNRLVHYRPASKSSVRVIDELPPEIFRMTVLKRVSLTLTPGDPDSSAGSGASQSQPYEPYEPDQLEAHQMDRALKTDLEKERLGTNLLHIYRKARSIEEEHGYNTLFLALGFLEWYESETSDELIHSPLVLVPVELTRRQAGGQFHLRSRDEDPILNPALEQRLTRELSVRLPVLPDDLDDFEPREFFNELALSVAVQKRWRMTTSIYLGLFSFTKFTMYKDLEAHPEAFATHSLVAALAGDVESRQSLRAPMAPRGAELDQLDPSACFHVMDVDSSQQEAIEAVKNGSNLVIEGPPGTGKSQTIANLIAECLAAGKSVLFVSEKMAALEVVYRRLERCGLSDYCFELHSHKTTRRRVIEELRRVLDLPPEKRSVKPEVLERLLDARETLNQYVRALHAPVAPLEEAPYDVMALLSLRPEPEMTADIFLRGAGDFDAPRFSAAREALVDLARALDRVRPCDEHPCRGIGLTAIDYEGRRALRRLLERVLEAHATLERVAGDVAAQLQTDPPTTIASARDLHTLARLLATSPRPSMELLIGEAFEALEPAARHVAELGADLETSTQRLLTQFHETMLSVDVEPVWRWWKDNARSILRFVKPSFWRHRRAVRSWTRSKLEHEEVVNGLGEAVRLRSVRAEIEEFDGTAFTTQWRGVQTDWAAYSSYLDWIKSFRELRQRGRVSDAILTLALDGHDVGEIRERLESACTAMEEAWDAFVEGADYADTDLELEALRDRLEGLEEGLDRLDDWVRYRHQLAHAKASDAASLVDVVHEVSTDQIGEVFERFFYRSWIEEVLPEIPEIRSFDASAHEDLIEKFRELDSKLIELNRIRAQRTLASRLPDRDWEASTGSDLGLLQREVRKKRGHVPLRKLFARVPRSLRRLKPCMMMSPLSVAQFLEPTAEPFDIVVFDEASQISTEDALGAIARGRQLVVVGDSKQLPPTPFFRSELPDGEPGDEEVGEGDLESVLDECVTVFPHRALLRWHYRSRSEALIAFSNHTYYGDQLFTFPSPRDGGAQLGVQFVHVSDGVYDRGGTGKNAIEAAHVAAAVFEQLKEFPDKSVGVGAFSVAQQEAIDDALEELRREDASLESHFDHSHPEYCFVKNLESIQGDERDVIFLSVGYGRDPDGRMSMNFGPLNQQGGARRLNVLVTRARELVRVFSSITAEDVDLSRTAAEGVSNLRSYLDYARRGTDALRIAGEADAADSDPLAVSVQRRLEAEGCEVGLSVGYSGYRVDLAVRDRQRWSLGIELDGATYGLASTARDRDRLRGQVMARLGWRLHRIWSPEWFRDQEREFSRLLGAVKAARQESDDGASDEEAQVGSSADARTADVKLTGGTAQVEEEAFFEESTAAEDAAVIPYELTEVSEFGDNQAFFRQRVTRLVRLLRDVVRTEGPIHTTEAIRRVAQHWGIKRLTAKVTDVMESTIAKCLREEKIVQRGDFFWPPGLDQSPIRRRDSSAPRDPELIAPEEIAAAITLILHKEYRVAGAGLIDRTARILGFSRTGSRVKQRLEDILEDLLRAGEVVENDGEYRAAAAAPANLESDQQIQAEGTSESTSSEDQGDGKDG